MHLNILFLQYLSSVLQYKAVDANRLDLRSLSHTQYLHINILEVKIALRLHLLLHKPFLPFNFINTLDEPMELLLDFLI